MKKTLFLSVVLFLALSSFCQKLNSSEVPLAVKNGFEKAHPNVSVKWEWEDKNYEANFTKNSKTMSCILDKQGNILETETLVAFTGLPQTARAYLEKNYKGKKPREIAKVEKADGTVLYEVVLGKKELLFDGQGNFKEAGMEKKEKD